MPPQLPVELLSSIVIYLAVAGRGPWSGLLKDLKSCCLAAKVLVSLCQLHIFHSVSLHFGRTIVKASHACILDTIRLFEEVVWKKPIIGFHVKKLQYRSWITVDSKAGIREVLHYAPRAGFI